MKNIDRVSEIKATIVCMFVAAAHAQCDRAIEKRVVY